MPDRADAGHLFVVNGDLTRLDCDAVLVPVDAELRVTRAWHRLVGTPSGGRLTDATFGSARVVRYRDGERKPGVPRLPDVWLGDFGRVGADDDWYVAGLREFVKKASRRKSVRRVAINVVGTGQGGRRGRKGSLFTSIVAAMATAAKDHGVDVVLVCWGPKAYSAAQRARRRTAAASASGERVHDLARLAQQGELVLFVGAGASVSAGLSSWGGLLEALSGLAPNRRGAYEDLESLDVRDQAAIISGWFPSSKAFAAALRELIASSTRYSLTHALLAGLGTRENVTTNYDTLFEAALATPDRGCDVLPYERATAGRTWLLKLHGSVDRPDDLVLTRNDYLSLPGRSGALFGLLQAMLMTKHILFVGYSLTDDSFHRVMHEVQSVMGRSRRHGPLGTAILLFEDPNIEALWGDLLHIVTVSARPAPAADDHAAWAAAGRRLDLFLDEICLLSADSAAFLLDRTYDGLLDDHERELRDGIRKLLSTTRVGEPIDDQLRRALDPFG